MSRNPLLLFAAILNKKPPLAPSWPNLNSLSFGWQAFTGPTSTCVIWPIMGFNIIFFSCTCLMVCLQVKVLLLLTFLSNSQMILLIRSKIWVKIRKFPSVACRSQLIYHLYSWWASSGKPWQKFVAQEWERRNIY